MARIDIYRSRNGDLFEPWLQTGPITEISLPVDPGTEVAFDRLFQSGPDP